MKNSTLRFVTSWVAGLATALLGTHAALASALGDGDEPLFAMLSDATPAPDGELPDTGGGLERERARSPSLITGAGYGTRASPVLRMRRDRAHFEERTRDATGAVTHAVAFDFSLSR